MRDKFKCKRSMRKALLLFSFLTLSITAYAQMANWIMRPEYDSIHLAAGVPVIISDSVNTTALWSTGGKRLASTADSLASFSDGLAVTVKKGSDVITGFYGVDGKFTPLKEYNTAWGFPYFRDGYLLVMKHGKGKLIGKDGKEDSFGSFVSMYPFSNGLACCTMYGDMEKLEDLYYYYIDKEKKPVKLMFDKKKEFMTSAYVIMEQIDNYVVIKGGSAIKAKINHVWCVGCQKNAYAFAGDDLDLWDKVSTREVTAIFALRSGTKIGACEKLRLPAGEALKPHIFAQKGAVSMSSDAIAQYLGSFLCSN